jgi:heme-degrading monooxygenase HmoA
VTRYHLAQINIARAVADLDSPLMAGFVSRLAEINALAERAQGFVWRLQSDTGDATSIRVFDDPRTYINLSVWETPEDLKNFVYRSAHVEMIRERETWFSRLSEQHQAAWWVPAGHRPSAEEGRDRLLKLREQGPSSDAFTLTRPFPHPGVSCNDAGRPLRGLPIC